jgi:hypothetical protein
MEKKVRHMDQKERILLTCGFLLLLFLTVVLTLFGAYKVVVVYHDLVYVILSILAALGITAIGYFLILQVHIEQAGGTPF